MIIRPYAAADADAVWSVLAPHIAAGETFDMPRDWGREQALARWCGAGRAVFVAEADGAVVGTSYIQPNRTGGGAHVANGGYAVHPSAAGRGIARALCLHSLDQARAAGYRAMQFNFVVSTNARAVAAWQSCGFAIVGTLPGAFRHPSLGYVDAYVMFQAL